MFSNPQGPNAGHSDSYAATGPPRGSHRRSSLKSSPDGSPYYTRQPSALPRVGVEDEYSKAPSRKSNASYTQALARMSTKHSMRSCASSMDGGDLKTRQRWKFSYIDPRSRWYKIFWYFVMSLALMSAIIEPFNIAFVDNSGFYPYGSFWSIFIIVSTFFFFLDITLNWLGRHMERVDGQPAWIKYIYSLYFSVIAFTSVGDGDWYAASPAESIAMILYLTFNLMCWNGVRQILGYHACIMYTLQGRALLRLTWEAVTSSPAVSEDLRDKVTQAMMMEAGSIFDFSDLGPNAADTVKGESLSRSLSPGNKCT
eukprot:gene4633-14827_t